jgi:methionyl-tRNA formyltransferase
VDGSGDPGKVLSVNPLLVGTGKGLLEIRSLQIEGKEETDADGFAATKISTTERFT